MIDFDRLTPASRLPILSPLAQGPLVASWEKTGMSSDRRMFLRDVGFCAAAALTPAALAQPHRANGGHPGIRFGVQLNAFPIDPEHFDTLLGVLGEIKSMGYQGFETSFRNVMPQFKVAAEARRKIDATGLTFFGVHIFLSKEKYDPATLVAPATLYEPVASGGAALGAKHLVLSGLPAADTSALKRKIDGLNRAGEFARKSGLTLAYHNHWPEFESKLGEIEALYTQTDPSLVSFVMDCGHAYRAGADVPAFIRSHAQRIVAFHLRDYMNGRLVSLGKGTFPLAAVAATIKQIGWKGWVENEEEREDLSQTGAQVIAPAYKAMKEAFAR